MGFDIIEINLVAEQFYAGRLTNQEKVNCLIHKEFYGLNKRAYRVMFSKDW